MNLSFGWSPECKAQPSLWFLAPQPNPLLVLVTNEKEKYLNYPFRGNLEYTAPSHEDCSSRNDLIREFSVQTRFYRNRTVSHLSEDTNFLPTS